MHTDASHTFTQHHTHANAAPTHITGIHHTTTHTYTHIYTCAHITPIHAPSTHTHTPHMSTNETSENHMIIWVILTHLPLWFKILVLLRNLGETAL